MSVYGNTNSRAKMRRGAKCPSYCFYFYTAPAIPPVSLPIYKSLVFPQNSYLLMSPGITFGSNVSPFTVEAWINAPTIPNGDYCLLGSGGTGVNGTAPYPNQGLSITNTSLTSWKVDSSGTAAQQFTLPTMTANTWYYFVITRDSSSYVQMWMGTTGTATASSSGRQLLNTVSWNFTSPTYLIGGWTNTNLFNTNPGLIINNLRITNTNLFSTSSASLTVPSANFTSITGTQLLLNNGTYTDQSGTQSLTTVGSPQVSSLSPF